MTAAPSAVAQGLTLTRLSKTYVRRGRKPVRAVRELDLSVAPGEVVVLLGPSGCGKTTTLRMIAGLERVTSGEIRIGDRAVQDLPPGERDVGAGFAGPALYPVLDVRGNLEYGLRARKVRDVAGRVQRLAERLQLTDLLGLRPAALSAAQEQRVVLARALIRDPAVLLLDEPLARLESAQRPQVRRELRRLQRELGCTTVVVTHDQAEALRLADRVAVVDAGVLRQFGTPDEIYDDPADLFVADFVGEPRINLPEAVVERRGPSVMARLGGGSALLTAATTAQDGQRVTLGLRPQDCRVHAPGDRPAVEGEVLAFEDLVEHGIATIRVDGPAGTLSARTPAGTVHRPGDVVHVTADPERVLLFDTATGARVR